MPNTIDATYRRSLMPSGLKPDSSISTDGNARVSGNPEGEMSHRLAGQTIVISEEARARLHAYQVALQAGRNDEATDLASPVSVAVAKTTVLTRAVLGLSGERQGVDLSRNQLTLPNADFHWDDLSALLDIPGLNTEERNRLSSALKEATTFDQQASSDPAIDITVRKMKLDYIRDNLVPEPFKAEADSAIASYVSHHVADQDAMVGMLTERMLAMTRETGLTEQAKSLGQELTDLSRGAASSQLARNRMLGAAQDRAYGTPAQADAASTRVLAAIKATLLENVNKWPREQERGRAEVNFQISHIQENWRSFVESVAIKWR